VALDTAADSSAWDASWDGFVAGLDVAGAPPGTSSFPWLLAIAGAVVVLGATVAGFARSGRRSRVLPPDWKSAAPAPRAGAPGVTRAMDGLPTYAMGRKPSASSPGGADGAAAVRTDANGAFVVSPPAAHTAAPAHGAPAARSRPPARVPVPAAPSAPALDPNTRRLGGPPPAEPRTSGLSLLDEAAQAVPAAPAAAAAPKIRRNTDFLQS
jgi:hypothetical protein